MSLTKRAFEECWSLLEMTLGEQVDGRKDAYWSLLKDELADAELKSACIRVARTETFFPKPVDLRPPAPDAKARSLQALNAYLDNYHPGDTKVFEDSLIHTVVMRMGGPSQLATCIRWSDNFGYEQFKREFRQIYEALIDAPPPITPRLVGEYEMHNEGRWSQHVPAPRLIRCPYMADNERLGARAHYEALLEEHNTKLKQLGPAPGEVVRYDPKYGQPTMEDVLRRRYDIVRMNPGMQITSIVNSDEEP